MRTFLFLIAAFFINDVLTAQLFTRITEGNIVNVSSDSRSVNFIDINNDNFEDIFISNGPSNGQNNYLYVNNGDGTFTRLTDDPIVEDMGKSDGATFADVDNDGFIDAYVVTWYGQKNFFYHNNGDGTFSYLQDVIKGLGGTYSETASWGDVDNDGFVDLYFSNSVNNSNSPQRNEFYINNGNNDFTKISQGDFVTEAHTSRSVNFTDYDGDGDQDLFVSNESNELNDLYENDGNGNFTKIENSNIVTSHKKSISSSWGDIDNDGDLDLFIANAGYFQEQGNQLYRNDGNGQFTEITSPAMANDGGCNYGSNFADYNNDGHLDLFVGSGFCDTDKLQDFLYLNDGTGQLIRDTESIESMPSKCSYGAAWGDYDNDGFLDLMVANCKNSSVFAAPSNTLFHNNGNENHWLKIKLTGVESNRSAIGAKIKIKANIDGQDLWQLREISAQSGYCGQNSLTAHFGLGGATQVDSIIIEWPSGLIQSIENENSDTYLFITEGIVNSTLNLGNLTSIKFTCQPNPVHNQLSVLIQIGDEESLLDSLMLTIYDQLGRVVHEKQLQLLNVENTYTFDVSKWESGVYVVCLRGVNFNISRKVVK